MFIVVIQLNVNSNTKRKKKSIRASIGDDTAQKGISLREVIKKVWTTLCIGLGIVRVISFFKDLLDQ